MDLFDAFASAPPAPQHPEATYPVPNINLFAPPYSQEHAEERREKNLTKKHTIADKMLLYNCSTQGKIEDLKSLLIDKDFSATEEVSKEGHYWTVMHYASHYGHIKILEFLIDYMKDKEEASEIFNLQTVEGKTPIFCAILSGDIKI